jgi:aspartyl-tRNA synthetase
MTRGAIVDSMRKRMKEQGFFEFQTPILTASSPEGARDFLVPSRIHPGKFYALPQAPQQYKQLLMMSGFDRYFQIAPCFRDEDPRADRLPGEFYQLDVEMSFVEQDDVFAAMEPVITGVFEEFAKGKPVTKVWPRIPFAEALRKYGSDKPDLRNPIIMQDVSEHFRGSGFKVFARMLEDPKNQVWAIPGPAAAQRVLRPHELLGAGRGPAGPRLHHVARGRRGRGSARQQHRPRAHRGDPRAARPEGRRCRVLRRRRSRQVLEVRRPGAHQARRGVEPDRQGRFELAWIVDFPMYEYNEDDKKVDFSHNPFSMPQGGLDALQRAGPADHQGVPVRHRLQRLRDRLRRHPQPPARGDGEGVRDRRLWRKGRGRALRRHVPRVPVRRAAAWRHGGGRRSHRHAAVRHQNLREISLFPMNQQAEDLLMGAPSEVTPKQLRELHIRLNLPQN